MSPLKPGEIHLLAQTIHHLEGARLQGVTTSKTDLILEFWLKGELYFIWFDDSSLRPYLTFWPFSLPYKIKKAPLPIGLFLKAHFLGRHLQTVGFYPELGRVLKLYFENDLSIEFRLFPHGQNVLAQTLEKSISLHKPKALQELSQPIDMNEALRSVEQFSQEWYRLKAPLNLKKSTPQKQSEASLDQGYQKKIKKLEKAVFQVSEDLKRKEHSVWRDVGEWLKKSQGLDDLPKDFEPFVDRKRSFSWNMNKAFDKAKETQRKISGTTDRLRILTQQLEKLKAEGPGAQSQFEVAKGPSIEKRVMPEGAKARTLHLSDDVKAMAGRSAKDNLQLLRQAKAWDLWFHLRDYPSSHLVVFRPKKRKLTAKEEGQIVQWFFHQTFGKRWAEEKGNRYDVIVAECRFVKPIKGDKIGRVHFQNERVIHVKVTDDKP